MIDYLKLFRIKNLVFLFVVQFLMNYVVIFPILQKYGFNVLNNTLPFFLLVSATIFITCAGYIINDYFDVKIDKINHPDQIIINKTISKQTAMLLHQVFTGIGIVLGLLLAYITRSYTLVFIFIVVPGLLWFYSASYKRQFIVGNLIVSFLSALSVLVVGITELAILHHQFSNLIYETPIPKEIYGWIGGFAFFAFIITWIREIIKDMEDEVGDREMECRTMPIKWGIKKTKFFLSFLIFITMFFLLIFNQLYIPFEGNLTLKYILLGLLIPLLVLIYLIYVSKNTSDFHQAASLTKYIMFSGVLYSIVFYFLMAKTYHLLIFNTFIIK